MLITFCPSGFSAVWMTEHISKQDMERITEFANTPAYKRAPEQLLPGADDQDEH